MIIIMGKVDVASKILTHRIVEMVNRTQCPWRQNRWAVKKRYCFMPLVKTKQE